MRKTTLVIALIFGASTVNVFAANMQTDKDKEKKEAKAKLMMKLAPGKSCSKDEHKQEKEEKKEDVKKP